VDVCEFLELAEFAVLTDAEQGVVLAHYVVVVLDVEEFVGEGSEGPFGGGFYIVVEAFVGDVVGEGEVLELDQELNDLPFAFGGGLQFDLGCVVQ
jgi:hypothetical protein